MEASAAPRTTRRPDAGFTLIELLIVIVILGVLATVTVFAVRGIADQGEASACASELRVLTTAEESYSGHTRITDIEYNPGV